MRSSTSITALILSIFIASISFGQRASLQAVSIVFTDARTPSSIDTIIPSGDQALNALLSSNGLSRETSRILQIDVRGGMDHMGDHQQIIMIQHEDDNGLGEPNRVEFIEVNGVRKTRDQLTPEELEKVEGHRHRTEEYQHGDQAKELRINNDASKGKKQIDVQIEEEVVNGETQRMIWINGEEATQAELDAIEQELEMKFGDDIEKEIVFIGKDEKGAAPSQKVEIKMVDKFNSSDEMKDAIVIVREHQNKDKAVSAMSLSTSFNLYPNPANDKVKLHFDTPIEGRYSIQITSLEGKVVRQLNGNAKKKSTTELDIVDLPAGTYIVTVGLEEGLLSSKLIIE